MANYDNSAGFYDRLSQIFFGKALVNAQVYLLHFIPANANVLIVGGGTGWILEEIAKIHPSGLHITYVEISANMTALARQKNTGKNQVEFINKPVEEVNTDQLFDVIVTPFLFDNFTEDTVEGLFIHMHQLLKADGLWLYTDFQLTGKMWQKILLRSMYLFFGALCNVPTKTLPDTQALFDKYGYKKIVTKTFFGDFIISKMFKKSAS